MATQPPIPVTPTTINWYEDNETSRNNKTKSGSSSGGSSSGSSGTSSNTPPQVGKPDLGLTLAQDLDNRISTAKSKVTGPNSSLAIPIAKGEMKAPKSLFKSIGFTALDWGLLKPLQVLDVGRRVVQSSIKNQADVLTGNQNIFEAGKDFFNEVKDPNLKSTELFGINTGNKWLDKSLGFVLDVGLDPTTYLTLGTGTAAKIGLQTAVKTVGKEATERIAREAAEDLLTKGVKEVTESAAKKFAKEIGEGATKKQVRQAAAATVAEASLTAVERGAKESVAKLAARRWTAVAPRKQLGFGARTATAQSIKELRDVAAKEAVDLAGTVAGRRAENFVATMTDDVIAIIAKRGIGGLPDGALRELGIAGGLRWGVGGAKVAVKGSNTRLLGVVPGLGTRNVGALFSATRLGSMNVPLLGGSTVAKFITGANVPEAVFDARTGLRAGTFKTSKEAINALDVLAKNTAYKGFKKTAAPAVKAVLARTLTKEGAPYRNTVYELLARNVDLTKSLPEIGTQVGRPVVQAELDFALRINKFRDDIVQSAKRAGIRVEDDGANFFPETLSRDAVKFLSKKSPEAKAVLRALGFARPPLPGQNIGTQLTADVLFFGEKVTNPDGTYKTLKQLNQIARDFGKFKGDFFDINADRALEKYGNKFMDDYGLMTAVNSETRSSAADTPGLIAGAAARGEGIVGLGKDVAVSSSTPEEVVAALTPWVARDFDNVTAAISAKARIIEGSALSNTARESAKDALTELSNIMFNLRQAVAAGDDLAGAWAILYQKTANEYLTLLSNSPEKIVKLIDNLKPDQLKTMVKLAEDTFVALDSHVVPDALVRTDLANIYNNINKLKNINERNAFIKGLNSYNTSVKTWYTSTVGFHTRNIISNYFQMFAGGASLKNISRGIDISNKWNEFLTKADPEILGTLTGLYPDIKAPTTLDELIDRFFREMKIPKADQNAAGEAIRYSGGAGFGDLEEVYSGNFGKIGITGKEATGRIPGTNIKVPGAQKVSETIGIIPTKSRSYGNKIEDQARFIFTFDGVKGGLTANESIARTAKFLVDYSDLSELDQIAKQFIPFWMWMSRNLPNQFVNMYSNPALYQQYNAARRNLENADGQSVLSPKYLMESLTPGFIKDAGGTILGQIPGVGGITVKPDFGFPGAGSPSPLQQGITDLDSLLASLSPGVRGPLEQLASKEFFSKQKLEGAPARVESAVETAIPQLSTLSRLLNIVAAGTDIPGLRNVPGVYKSKTASGNIKSTPDDIKKIQAFLSYIGIPIGIVGGNEQNISRYDILEELKKITPKKK